MFKKTPNLYENYKNTFDEPDTIRNNLKVDFKSINKSI